MTRRFALAGAALAGLLGLTTIAQAGSRDWRHDRNHDHNHTDVRIDIDLGRPAPTYEERTTRVWVEPVYRTECDRVWVEPVYREECERVWIPDRWERRDVVHGHGRHQWTTCETVLVERGHWAERPRRVVACDGHWETRERQVCVTPGHWEYRTERVRVDDGCAPNPWFDVFARWSR